MLENAFDDVSFDNDEGSNFNPSNNHSLVQNKSSSGIDILHDVGMTKSQIEYIKNCPANEVENFNTPVRHIRNVKSKIVDFNNENNHYSDQSRMQKLNGSLHDVVDASGGGGGGDVAVSLHYKHCYRTSPIGKSPFAFGYCN